MSTAENITGLADDERAQIRAAFHEQNLFMVYLAAEAIIEAREAKLRANIGRQIRDQIPPHGLKCCDGMDIAARIAEGGN